MLRTRSNNHLQARANYVAHLQNQFSSWIVDSGATHHIVSDTQSLITTQHYHCSEEVVVGNGNKITISHTCNVNFNASNHQFQLQQVLFPPAITNNLIFVANFCQDNNSFMEFIPFLTL